MDLYPTILELTGVDIPPDIDGSSLLAEISPDDSLMRDAIFWHYPHYHSSGWTPGAAVRSGKWKLIEFYDLEKVELYDLEADPGETTDLSAIHPDIVEQLTDKLRQFQENTDAKLPTANKPII
jgi:arylsulfatase A-like enzyme